MQLLSNRSRISDISSGLELSSQADVLQESEICQVNGFQHVVPGFLIGSLETFLVETASCRDLNIAGGLTAFLL